MSSQLFFRDKGRIWRYNVITKGADSNPLSMGLLILEANGEIRYKRLEFFKDASSKTTEIPCQVCSDPSHLEKTLTANKVMHLFHWETAGSGPVSLQGSNPCMQ